MAETTPSQNDQHSTVPRDLKESLVPEDVAMEGGQPDEEVTDTIH